MLVGGTPSPCSPGFHAKRTWSLSILILFFTLKTVKLRSQNARSKHTSETESRKRHAVMKTSQSELLLLLLLHCAGFTLFSGSHSSRPECFSLLFASYFSSLLYMFNVKIVFVLRVFVSVFLFYFASLRFSCPLTPVAVICFAQQVSGWNESQW